MEKNIAAIVREGTYTVGVVFNEFNKKEYTYIATFDVKVGDQVIVDTSGEFKLVGVTRVDDFLNIPPGSSTKYKYLVGKVDMDGYNEMLEQNAQIEQAMSKQYNKNMRTSYRERVMESLDPEARLLIQQAIGGTGREEEIKAGGTE